MQASYVADVECGGLQAQEQAVKEIVHCRIFTVREQIDGDSSAQPTALICCPTFPSHISTELIL